MEPSRICCVLSIALLTTLLVGCAERRVDGPPRTADGVWPTRTTRVIEIHGPIAVAFSPNLGPAEIGFDEGADSALEHFGYAVEEMDKCLRPLGIATQVVRGEVLVIQDGTRRRELRIAEASNESMGCLLIAPNREPKIVRATAGPSSLVVLCPAAASTYFGIPECCPDGFKCCPNGRVVDVEFECGG